MLKVFLGGEGKNDIGTRWHAPMGNDAGVVEVLLRRVRASGWRVAGARCWQQIRKYRAGAGQQRPNHADAHNVLGLVLHAYEEACEMLAFVRDGDGDELREREIQRMLEVIGDYRFADEYHYELAIVGGVAKPKLEGWILCLLGAPGTDDMTRAGVDRALAESQIAVKSTEHYVIIATSGMLPSGKGSLPSWLALARTNLGRLIDGEAASESL
jgi:hypothetical protein